MPALSGLRDKLYWRSAVSRRDEVTVRFHCFKKHEQGGYISLCGYEWRRNSGGQGCRRPRAELRCGICDGAEMKRRGWSESGPASPA